MFPADTVSIQRELSGPGSLTIIPGTNVKYILGISIQQSGTASTSQIQCGATILALNYGKDFSSPVNYRCESIVLISKTGQDSASFIISYVPRDILLPSQYNPLRNTDTQAIDVSTNSALFVGAGQYMNLTFIFFLFVIFYMFYQIGKGIYRR